MTATCFKNLTSGCMPAAGVVEDMKPAERESRASSVLSGFCVEKHDIT